MAENSLAQNFASSYSSANRRIGGSSKTHSVVANSPFGKTVNVFTQRAYQAPAPVLPDEDVIEEAAAPVIEEQAEDKQAAAMEAWSKRSDLNHLQNADSEAKRLVGDVVTVWHIDFTPTAAMTPCWTAYATAYGLRFKVLLWLEDIEFLSQSLDLSISRGEVTPEKPLEIVVRKLDRKRGLTGASGVFVGGKCLFLGETLEDIS